MKHIFARMVADDVLSRLCVPRPLWYEDTDWYWRLLQELAIVRCCIDADEGAWSEHVITNEEGGLALVCARIGPNHDRVDILVPEPDEHIRVYRWGDVMPDDCVKYTGRSKLLRLSFSGDDR